MRLILLPEQNSYRTNRFYRANRRNRIDRANRRDGPTGVTILTGISEPECSIGLLEDVYIDLSDGGTYYKITQSIPPALATIPLPTGTVIM